MQNSGMIIGGADGPTEIFIAGELGMSWLNVFGLILVVLLLIPNIIYAFKVKKRENKCTNRFMNILEQIENYNADEIEQIDFRSGYPESFRCYRTETIY